ncbi:MAG: hypothetical protein ABSC08_11440, partial [Bryobacteraceae bacterium]
EVDGKTYSGCPLQFDWAPGSSHTIATTSPQSSWWNWYFVPVGVMDGGQEIWTSWSDGGAMSHTVETPAAATTYTANFKTRFLLVTSVSPAGGGTIQPATGPTGAWYDENTVVTVTATPNPGYTFSGWWGGCYGNGPCQVTMQSPGAVIANFAPGP